MNRSPWYTVYRTVQSRVGSDKRDCVELPYRTAESSKSWYEYASLIAGLEYGISHSRRSLHDGVPVELTDSRVPQGQFNPAMTSSMAVSEVIPDQPNGELAPSSPARPKFNTGRLPNTKASEGKPRLLLMGQRR